MCANDYNKAGRSRRKQQLYPDRFVQCSSIILITCTLLSVSYFAPGSAIRLFFGLPFQQINHDGQFESFLHSSDIQEPVVHPHFYLDENGEDVSCNNILLYTPSSYEGDLDISSQMSGYLVASLIATYTNMAMVILENESDQSIGCPDDIVEEHGSTIRFGEHYKMFPKGFSTLIKHPEWLSRKCPIPCQNSYTYEDWFQLRSGDSVSPVLCQDDNTNVLFMTRDNVLNYFETLKDEMVGRSERSSIASAHNWAIRLGGREDEAAILSTMKDEDDILDYARALASRSGLLRLQPWISRDVEAYTKQYNVPFGTKYDAMYLHRSDTTLGESDMSYVPIQSYLKLFQGKDLHRIHVVTNRPVEVQEEMKMLPRNRFGHLKLIDRVGVPKFTFTFGPIHDSNRWNLKIDCRDVYSQTIADVAELMTLVRSDIFLGEYNSNWWNLVRFFRLRLNKSVDILTGHESVSVKEMRVAWVEKSNDRDIFGLDQNPALADPSIHFFIKTSGKSAYLKRARLIADTWGKGTDERITFLFDSAKMEEVNSFDQDHPWVTVKRVDGTDKQGGYKGRAGRNGGRREAHQAQRIKTRAVFTEFVSLPSKPEWICYLDDDMVVNIQNLRQDLLSMAPICSPNCLIADGQKKENELYTVGGWCMEHNLVQRVAQLLEEKSDRGLGWFGTDDVHFNRQVMQRWLQVKVKNSDRWYSEYSRPVLVDGVIQKRTWNAERRTGRYPPLPTWENDADLMKKFVPPLAVYHKTYLFKDGG